MVEMERRKWIQSCLEDRMYRTQIMIDGGCKGEAGVNTIPKHLVQVIGWMEVPFMEIGEGQVFRGRD